MKNTYPAWAQSVTKLREYAKYRHLKMQTGGTFKMVFFHAGTPLGERWLRPHLLKWKEEYQTVYGRFQITHPVTMKQAWSLLVYYRALEGFCWDLPADLWELATNEPEVHYYGDDEREAVRNQFAKIEEIEPWLKDGAASAKARS